MERGPMKLAKLAKDDKSGDRGCPVGRLADTGELVVQGARPAGSDLGEPENLLPGETAVRIAPETVLRATERHRGSRQRQEISSHREEPFSIGSTHLEF